MPSGTWGLAKSVQSEGSKNVGRYFKYSNLYAVLWRYSLPLSVIRPHDLLCGLLLVHPLK